MGASGGIPSIGVRLSAQGVTDVVAAFQRVREEGRAAGEETTASFGALTKQMESLTELIPVITLGLFAEKIVEAGKSALETADQLAKLSERTGANVGTLSVLAMVAHDVGLDFDQFSGGLTKLAKAMDEASNGVAKPKKSFSDLGITLNDLKTKDPSQVFELVAQRLDAMAGGSEKNRIEMTLLGRAGAALDPLLHNVATRLEEATDRAKKFGIYLDSEGAAAAVRASEALKEVGDIAQGLATQFSLGFAPQLAAGVEMFASDIAGKGVSSMRSFGDTVGKIFRDLVGIILLAGHSVDTFWEKLKVTAPNNFAQLKAEASGLANGGIAGAVIAGKQYGIENDAKVKAKTDAIQAKFDAELAKLQADIAAPIVPSKLKDTGKSGADKGADGLTDEERNKQLAARSAYEQALADNQLAIQKALNSAAEAEDKRHYDAGLLSTNEYYDKVEQRIRSDAAAQLSALNTKYKGASDLPTATPEERDKRATELAKITAQETELGIKSNADIEAAEGARAAAHLDNAKKELEITKQLSQATGDRFTAEEDQLKLTLKAYDDLLKKEGKLTDAQRAAKVAAVGAPAQARIDFGRNQQKGSEGLASLNEDVQGIQEQAANGSISQIDATAQIIRLEETRLAGLKAIGAQMTQDAKDDGSDADAAAAKKFNDQLDVMASKIRNVKTAQTYLVDQLATQGRSAVEDFFTEGISGAKSFGDAMKDLADVFEQMVARMIAKLLVFYALEAILNWISPSAGSVLGKYQTGLQAAGPFGFAEGGWTGGTAGQPAGIVHGEEYVIQAGPAAKYRSLLDAINNGTALPDLKPLSSASGSAGYADSVASTSPVTASSPGTVVNIHTTEATTQTQSTSSNGTNIIDVVVGKAKAAVHQDIASGGPIAKQMEGQYALSRGGVRRG